MNIKKIAIFKLTVVVTMANLVCVTWSQGQIDPDENVRRAAACLRAIPGLIEGKTLDDIANDNAHFVVFQEARGRIGFQKTIIRLHRGVREGKFLNIDQSRVRNCMIGLARLPVPQ